VSDRIVCQNKKAYHDFAVEVVYEVGMVLTGPEVKSLRNGRANMGDGYAQVKNNEVFLYNVHITPYAHAGHEEINPLRTRKLLLSKREINKLIGRTKEKGLALIPLKIYFNDRGLAKLALALARGKKQYDKRADLKKKEGQREIERGYKKNKKDD